MKKTILFLIVCMGINALFSFGTPSSAPFANSYLQRATGVEAVYWNPANIPNIPTSFEIMSFSAVGSFENNMLSLDLYNRIMGQFLDEEIKMEMLDAIDKNFSFGVNANSILAAVSYENFAYSTGVNVAGRGKVDKQFLELILIENDYDKVYDFTAENNDFLALGYQDFTVGYGGFHLNQFFNNGDNFPNIYAGMSMSFLMGYYMAEMTHFDGVLSTDDVNGLVLDQYTDIKTGQMGTGFKMSLGFSMDAVNFAENHYITAGLSFDNLFASMRWRNNTEMREYHIYSNNYFFNHLEKDIWEEDEETYDIDSFISRLPFILRLGGLYRQNDFSASLDYAHNFGNSKAFNYDPNISMGLEYVIHNNFPVQVGFRLPIGDLNAICSMGAGYRHRNFEIGLAYQSFDAFYSNQTKGLAYSMYMKGRF